LVTVAPALARATVEASEPKLSRGATAASVGA
jgi:hypothetical protein